jgi:hypothetical protein
MAMGPKIAIHRDVEIRYGYSISDDLFYAHVDPPAKQQASTVQPSVRTDMSPDISFGKHKVSASIEQDVPAKARALIDQYFAERVCVNKCVGIRVVWMKKTCISRS